MEGEGPLTCIFSHHQRSIQHATETFKPVDRQYGQSGEDLINSNNVFTLTHLIFYFYIQIGQQLNIYYYLFSFYSAEAVIYNYQVQCKTAQQRINI